MNNLLMFIALVCLLLAVVISYSVISSLALSISKIDIANSKILPKEVLSRFEEYLLNERILESVIVLNYRDATNTIVYSLAGSKFVAKLIGDKFYRM